MKIKKSQLKIGTELYQYSSKIIPYKIIGINELKTDDHVEIFYILECLSCNDHKPCKIAIKINDYGYLEYNHMINHYSEYDEENEHFKNEQYYWHRNKEYYWFLTRKDAREFIHNKNISYYEREIKKNEEKIKEYKNKITEEHDKINALNNQ